MEALGLLDTNLATATNYRIQLATTRGNQQKPPRTMAISWDDSASCMTEIVVMAKSMRQLNCHLPNYIGARPPKPCKGLSIADRHMAPERQRSLKHKQQS